MAHNSECTAAYFILRTLQLEQVSHWNLNFANSPTAQYNPAYNEIFTDLSMIAYFTTNN